MLFWQVSNFVSVFYGCPYVKMNRNVIRYALKQIDVKKNDIFYDLGCGNGDVLIEASKFGIKTTGFEISPYYYLLAKLHIFILLHFYNLKILSKLCYCKRSPLGMRGYSNIAIRYKNIFDVDLGSADIIYCYLLPKLLVKLSPKFVRELKSTARVISIGFPIPKLKLIKKVHYRNHQIFIYSKRASL